MIQRRRHRNRVAAKNRFRNIPRMNLRDDTCPCPIYTRWKSCIETLFAHLYFLTKYLYVALVSLEIIVVKFIKAKSFFATPIHIVQRFYRLYIFGRSISTIFIGRNFFLYPSRSTFPKNFVNCTNLVSIITLNNPTFFGRIQPKFR